MGAWDRIAIKPGDLTKVPVDAIVNAANRTLLGGGGVDGAIHHAAGPGLVEECRTRYPEGCETGDAKITSGHQLPAKYVIHTVGPIYRDGTRDEPKRLRSCHTRTIKLAAEAGDVRTIAFPAISTGAYGYPWKEAAEVSLQAVADALEDHPTIERAEFILFLPDLQQVFQETYDRLRR